MPQVLDRPRAGARRTSAPVERPAPLWLRSVMAAVWDELVGTAVLLVASLVVSCGLPTHTHDECGSAMRVAAVGL